MKKTVNINLPELIILVDDDDTSNFITELLIKSIDEETKVHTLSNGKEAMEYFSGGSELPKLVFIDINMPLVNGFEFLDYYSSKKWNDNTKFAIYSSSTRLEDFEKSKKYNHIVDYIEKPLTIEKMESLMSKLAS